uniref:Uncharacterized protein n=1 Tax=Anguilla anguilla TaxID=7936 RepID=A0A0E9TIH4_ANGAN
MSQSWSTIISPLFAEVVQFCSFLEVSVLGVWLTVVCACIRGVNSCEQTRV